jgi:Ni,Fe-hydrogenase I small subunit
MHPNFPDLPTSPFFTQVELVPAYFGLNVDTVAEVAGVGVALALGAHAVHHALAKKSDQTETSQAKSKSERGSQ